MLSLIMLEKPVNQTSVVSSLGRQIVTHVTLAVRMPVKGSSIAHLGSLNISCLLLVPTAISALCASKCRDTSLMV